MSAMRASIFSIARLEYLLRDLPACFCGGADLVDGGCAAPLDDGFEGSLDWVERGA